jgi:hypothetical protein
MVNEHFIKFIQSINEKPGMYLVNNVRDMNLIFLGYLYAPIDKKEADSLGELISGFNMFVNKHYKSKSDYHWAKLIYFHSSSDTNSIEVFSTLFDKFVKGIR